MGIRNPHAHPALFKFFNGVRMRIILNKRKKVGIGVIYLKLVSLSSLITVTPWI